MNHFCKITLFLLVLQQCKNSFACQKDTIEIISVKLEVDSIDQANELKYANLNYYAYFVTFTLTNTQDTSIMINTMTCSWAESFTSDNSLVWIEMQQCDSNFPTTIELKPHDSKKFKGRLRGYIKTKDFNDTETFKIGFASMSDKDLFWSYKPGIIKKYKIYWSNRLLLADLKKLHQKI